MKSASGVTDNVVPSTLALALSADAWNVNASPSTSAPLNSNVYILSSSIFASAKSSSAGASLIGFTVTVKSELSVYSPSVTFTLTVILPL